MKKKIFFLVIAVILIGLGVYFVFFREGGKTTNVNVKPSYAGRWSHYVDWTKDDEVVRKSYSEYVLTDKEWTYYGYNLETESYSDEIKQSGTYEISKDNKKTIYFYYEEDGTPYYREMYVDGDKLCQEKTSCQNYFVKENSKLDNHLTLPEIIED